MDYHNTDPSAFGELEPARNFSQPNACACQSRCVGPIIPALKTAYGGLYDSAALVLDVPAGVPQVLPMGEFMASENVVLGNNSVTIVRSGDYRVEFMVLMQAVFSSFGLTVGVRINGVFSQPLTTATVIDGDFQSITLSSIVPLNAGDVLSLAVLSVAGGTLLFGPDQNINPSVIRLGS